MDNPSRAISALTSLIDVNNKRMKTYQSLAEKTAKNELRTLFHQWADQSKGFSKSLSTWRAAYGGFGSVEKNSGIADAWLQLKSLFDGRDNKDVVTRCKDIEQSSLKAYKSTIDAEVLPTAAVADVERQVREFERTLAKLDVLRR
jgi:uncharacterized protein (TIGR02284 family)